MLLWLIIIILSPFLFLILPTRVIGKKYLKKIKNTSAIICANHQTMNDPIIFKYRIDPNLKIMAKDSLFKNKFISWFLKKLGAYPVNRGGNDITAVKTTLKYLKNNKKVLIFPEGTRIKNNENVQLKNGVVLFALKTNCYVVPCIFRKITNPFVFNTLLISKPFKFSEMEEFKNKSIDKDLLEKASKILQGKLQFLKTVPIKEYKSMLKNDVGNNII